MRPSEPKILKIALIHEIVCICSIFLCRPPFLQIQSNNSLGNLFFFVLFLCCISHVQKNYFSLLTFSPPPVLSSSDLCTNSNEKRKMLALLKNELWPAQLQNKKPNVHNICTQNRNFNCTILL